MHEWMNQAECRNHDPELFFPKSDMSTSGAQQALAVCRDCPVIAECSMYRRRLDVHLGVWHGKWFRPKDKQHDGLRDDALLMFAEGMGSMEIAAELDVPRQRVASWITREKERVKREERNSSVLREPDPLVVPAQMDRKGLAKVWDKLRGAPHGE